MCRTAPNPGAGRVCDVDPWDTLTQRLVNAASAVDPVQRKFWVRCAGDQLQAMGLVPGIQPAPRGMTASVAPTVARKPVIAAGAARKATPVNTVPKTVVAAPRADLSVAAHEAGHAVVSVLVGGQIDHAEVLRGGPRTDPRGRAGFCRQHFGLVAGQRRGEMFAAGTAAQAVALYGPRPTLAQLEALLAHNSGDREELRRLNFASGESVVTSVQEVLPLVLRVWPSIAKLAVDLDARGSIGHADVTAALGLSGDRARHPFELANIRSGLRKVPDPRVSR